MDLLELILLLSEPASVAPRVSDLLFLSFRTIWDGRMHTHYGQAITKVQKTLHQLNSGEMFLLIFCQIYQAHATQIKRATQLKNKMSHIHDMSLQALRM